MLDPGESKKKRESKKVQLFLAVKIGKDGLLVGSPALILFGVLFLGLSGVSDCHPI